MDLFGGIKRALRLETKASAAAGAISAYTVGRPVWTDREFGKLAEEAYKINPVANHIVRKMATGCAAVPLLLHGKGGKEITEHPLLDLLNNPAPGVSGQAMREMFFSYLLLSGNSYLEAVGPARKNAPPRELWNLRPDRMKVVPGANGVPQGHEYEVNGRKVTWMADPITGKSPILHVKEFNPLNDWYGLSRVDPAAYAIDRHNAAAAHNKALLDNGARPSGALVFGAVKANGNDVSAPDEVIDQARVMMNKTHAGPHNAGKPYIFGGNVHWEEMGLSPRDMDFAAGKDDAAWDICLAFGYPPLLLVKGNATLNNYSEAKLELWEETLLPLLGLGIGGLNSWLCPMFGDDLKLSPDLDAISALEPRRETKRTSATGLVAGGVIDTDEAREALQFGPRPANAVEKIDAAVLKALIEAADVAGMTPLIRYMRSVSLYDPSWTDEQIIEAANAHLAGDTGTPAGDTAL